MYAGSKAKHMFLICVFMHLSVTCKSAIFLMQSSRAFGQVCDPVDCACGQVKGRHSVLLGPRLAAITEWNSTRFLFHSLTNSCTLCLYANTASTSKMNWLFL